MTCEEARTNELENRVLVDSTRLTRTWWEGTQRVTLPLGDSGRLYGVSGDAPGRDHPATSLPGQQPVPWPSQVKPPRGGANRYEDASSRTSPSDASKADERGRRWTVAARPAEARDAAC